MGALDELLNEAEETEQKDLQAAGVDTQYNLWRESMPDERLPNEAALDMFLWATDMESAAQEGRLSVSTGGTEIGPDTDIPTPGPDDEGTGPDGAGDTSQGGDGRDTDLKLVEGMWEPPPESMAENYVEPTTREMIATPEWVKNAKIYYKFHQGNLDVTDEDAAQWAKEQLGFFNWNLMSTLDHGSKIMSGNDPKVSLAFLNLINMYDHSDGGAIEFGGALLGLATDPTTYFGLGVGGLAAKGVAKATAKEGLKKAVTFALAGGTAGLIEGGSIGGGFDLTKQNVEQEAGARQDIDYARAGKATAAGGALGVLLGGGGGHLAGRYGDKLAAAAEKEMVRQMGGSTAAERRSIDDMTEKQMIESLSAMQRAEAAEGRPDSALSMAGKLTAMMESGKAPRNKDGTIDLDAAVKQIVDEMPPASKDVIGAFDTLEMVGYKMALGENSDSLLINTNRMSQEARDKVNDAAMASEVVTDNDAISFNRPDDQIREEHWIEIVGTPEQLQHFANNLAGKSNVTKIRQSKFADLLDNFNDSYHGWRYDKGADELTFYNRDQWDQVQAAAEEAGLGVKFGKAYEGEDALWITGGTLEQRANFVMDQTGVIDSQLSKMVDTKKPGKVPLSESEQLQQRIVEMDELQAGGVVTKAASRPGSIISRKGQPGHFELVGRTKNGWYRAVSKRTGEEINLRRKDFDVLETAPAPEHAGPMSLDPFGSTAAKVIAMTEELSSSKLREINISHAEQEAIVKDLRDMGIKIDQKRLATHWTPAEMLFLRNTYNSQANGIADMAMLLKSHMKRGDRLVDKDLARFNEAHTQFVATRDLFFGVSGNAARTLNILKSRPTDEVYQFSQSLLDSINMSGGRVATERSISLMADFAAKGQGHKGGKLNTVKGVSKISDTIWGSRWKSAVLNARYNMMLSSWRTHFFNFLGNSASGLYHHLLVSPVAGVINNATYATRLAISHIPGVPERMLPDAAERFTMKMWGAETGAHFQSAMDSLRLAKEIAMGRDIGEGKVWNELGLRYDVINVPNTAFGKMGTTPVRLLEAGDAFFKNQYYSSKINAQAARKARFEEVYGWNPEHGSTYDEAYAWWKDNPDSTMERQAKEFAAKMTYTNDPNVYGGIFAVLAKGMQTMQSRSLFFNMLVPFVRTPANLISFSMEMIGANALLSPSITARSIMHGTPLERQEALSRLTVAVGMWYTVHELHKEGLVTGAGPVNWEEIEAWKAAGWQPNSGKFGDTYVDMARAQPAGRAINLMATVRDYMMINPHAEAESSMAWLGAGLLYTADNVIDESYMSTLADFISAVQAKQPSRTRSLSASSVNSVIVPNLLRDLRRPADATMRSSSSTNVMDQIVKQMKNATPGLSDNLAPNRDWKGDPKNYYGNSYTRALVPFAMRDSTDTDPASMAIAYSRIAPSVPDKKIAMPGGVGNFIDLFAMDNGDGFVYDKYVEFVGKARFEAVNTTMKDSRWNALVQDGDIGPGSDGDSVLRRAIAIGSKLGRERMLEFLINHSDNNSTFKRANGDTVMIHHTFSVAEYVDTLLKLRQENIPVPDDMPQYELRGRRAGPEFFKP